MSSKKFKVSPDIVERTYRMIRLALELDEYWRRSAPLYEFSEEEVAKLLSLVLQMEELISQLKKELGFKP